ncbi:alpha/beta fold hydrolase [Thalassotalea ponticola]|uniref:alpha/beta fold hydrolase n=1 Tax=Thalassotalea ponticola TaxID=1523392 RepID=UPI0025B38A21|nr:alpha/beta fold hydrolase [Thalassotalea ponticola]MDN3651471.1 alpha/beta fold hydrolase [Thalassotalea ponticola]
MSDKIYFNTANKFSFKKSMVNITTRIHHRVAPAHAEKTARKLLLTPVRLRPQNPEPEGLVKGTVMSNEGKLKTYQLGSGPVWVLSHGWSGSANQFYPLMQHIAEQGYTAVAYDHPGHGHSEGDVGHIPAFVHGLETILDSVGDVAGVVGHSMGTATILECQYVKLKGKPLMLIAPVLDYLDNLLDTIKRSGYSIRLFNAVVAKVEQQYNYPLNSIDPFSKLKLRDNKTIIVHDPADRFANYNESQRADKEIANVQLVTAHNQGHGRIMKSQQVMSAFDQLC